MARTLGLTELQRKFVAEYRGRGDGLRAAKAAGFKGADTTTKVTASRLLKHPGVKAALEAKFAEIRKARETEAKKGGRSRRSIGSTTRRLELLMQIAEDPRNDPRARTSAIKVAAEIAGEIGRHRFDPPATAPSIAESPEPTSAPTGPAVHPGSRVPPRLLVINQERGNGG